MKKIIAILFLLASIYTTAQTKLISHRSHSGSNESFAKQILADEIPNSNLGAAPTHLVRIAKLDSLIYINDSSAIMVTSLYCKQDYDEYDKLIKWRPGKDTVRNHPLFCKKHQLNKIKLTIKNDYNFNDVNNIKYIGYDNKEISTKQKQIIQKQDNPKKTQDVKISEPIDETRIENQPSKILLCMAAFIIIGIGKKYLM